MAKKIVLSTTPTEGGFVDWTTPEHFMPKAVKYMPLGILSLATNITGDHEIVVLDPSSEGWGIEEAISRINNEKPDILGLSVPTRSVYAMNQILRKISVPYKVVGGPHATYYSEQILKAGADAVFVGPLADLEFNKAIETQPKGIIYCKTNINEINFPKREFLNVEEYFPKTAVLFKAPNRLPMFSSIGCPNRCNFCNVQSKIIQLKEPKKVVDEMEYLFSLGCRSVHVLDDNFNVIRSHVAVILDEMEKRNFKVEWSGRGQTRMDLTLTKRMAESGFKRIHVGFEALDDDILKFFNKSETVADIVKFCKEMNENNIDILGYFILGSPVETEEYRKKLPEMIRELGIKYPYFNILFPEPDTEYYRQLLKQGFYKKDYWREYMENPVPNFRIPYPYSEEKKNQTLNYVNELLEKFKKN